jgi:hypothetical protein
MQRRPRLKPSLGHLRPLSKWVEDLKELEARQQFELVFFPCLGHGLLQITIEISLCIIVHVHVFVIVCEKRVTFTFLWCLLVGTLAGLWSAFLLLWIRRMTHLFVEHLSNLQIYYLITMLK